MPFTLRDFQDPTEQATQVSRYLTFEKFVSLLELNAMWFSSLASLQDRFEGTLPRLAFERLHRLHLSTKESFPIEEARNQFDGMAARNVSDGRDLTVINCWFLGAEESSHMWQTYAPDGKGVLIFSTVARLNTAFMIGGGYVDASQLGRVQYVNFETLDLPEHIASDAGHRAFLKHHTFETENEVRLTTLNAITPGCLNPDGSPISAEQTSGKGVTQPGRKGIYVRCSLPILIERIIVSPFAQLPFQSLVRRLVARYRLSVPVED
jgi:hypothetical protein